MPQPADEKPTLPQGPGFVVTFLYYFSGTALITTLLATQTLGLGLETGMPNQLGLLCGAVGGLLGALANRSRTVTIPYSSQTKFKQRLNAVLLDMGYSEDQAPSLEGILVYRRPSLGQWFSGKVYVQLAENQAYISSRAAQVSRLQKRLTQGNPA